MRRSAAFLGDHLSAWRSVAGKGFASAFITEFAGLQPAEAPPISASCRTGSRRVGGGCGKAEEQRGGI